VAAAAAAAAAGVGAVLRRFAAGPFSLGPSVLAGSTPAFLSATTAAEAAAVRAPDSGSGSPAEDSCPVWVWFNVAFVVVVGSAPRT